MEGGRGHDPSAWSHSSKGRSVANKGCVPNRLREAPEVDKMSLPNKGVGQDGMTRKEWVKGIPSREHDRRPVLKGLEGVPSIPITDTWEGYVWPEWAGNTE